MYVACSILKTKVNSIKHFSNQRTAIFIGKLKNAVSGKVVTRFPPEPSGYMHIGHVKAIVLNRYFADIYNGKMILRFDDTNPGKESKDYVDGILSDISNLHIKYDGDIDYCSNHFEEYETIMTKLILEGKCYVDNTPVEVMREEREKGISSKNRNNSIEYNLNIWNNMRNKELEWSSEYITYVVRGKFPFFNDKNKCMRDPVFYRFIKESHYRTGNKHKLYPTYDFICPIADEMNGVTHLLRTSEYADRIPLYKWVENAVGLRSKEIYEYSRLNFMYTVLSKRKLKWLVENGKVEGWDDPRLPTIRGLIRRGISTDAMKEFILTIGPSKNINHMSWDKLYSINREIIDFKVKRLFGISSDTYISAEIINYDIYKKEYENNEKVVDWNIKNKEQGTRKIHFSKKIGIDIEDAKGFEVNEKIIISKIGICLVNKIIKEGDKVIGLSLSLELDNKDFKKLKVINWVSLNKDHGIIVEVYEYDHILSKEKIEDEDNLEDYININSIVKYSLYVESVIKEIEEKSYIQLERKGYFYIDKKEYNKENQALQIRLHKIPTGKLNNRI